MNQKIALSALVILLFSLISSIPARGQSGCQCLDETGDLVSDVEGALSRAGEVAKREDMSMLRQLQSRWQSLELEDQRLEESCQQLMPECRSLDSLVASLNTEGTALEAEHGNLEAERRNLDSQCAGELPEEQYNRCNAWLASFNARINDYNRRAGDRNRRLADYERRDAAWNARSDSQNSSVSAWENKVRDLLTDLNEFIRNASARKQPMLPARAAELVDMLNDTAKKLNLPKGGSHDQMSLNCSSFFRGVGRELKGTGLPASGGEWSEGLNANKIAEAIQRNNSWEGIQEGEAQDLANKGAVVVGIAQDLPHGHVAIASPIPAGLDEAKFPGRGPFVRDGNEHYLESEQRLYASSWGAVKASKAFSYGKNPPKWFVWKPSRSD